MTMAVFCFFFVKKCDARRGGYLCHWSSTTEQEMYESIQWGDMVPLKVIVNWRLCRRLDNVPSVGGPHQRELWKAFLHRHETVGCRHASWPDQPTWNVQRHGWCDCAMVRLPTETKLSHRTRCGTYQPFCSWRNDLVTHGRMCPWVSKEERLFQLIYKAPWGRNFGGAFSFQRWDGRNHLQH